MADTAKITWEGDSKSVEQAYARMVKENAKLSDGLRQLKVDSASANQAMVDKFNETIRKLKDTGTASQGTAGVMKASFTAVNDTMTRLAGTFLTMEAGIRGAQYVMREFVKDTEALLTAREKLNESIVGVTVPSGIPGAEVERWLSLKSDATDEQRVAALAGVAKAAPDLERPRQFGIAELVAQLAPRRVDLKELGGLAADIGQLLPNRNPGDVVDVAVKLQNMLGEKVGGFSSDAFQRAMAGLVKSGMSGEDAMANGVVALLADQKANVLTTAKGRQLLPKDEVTGVREKMDQAFAGDERNRVLADLQTYGAGRESIAKQMVEARKSEAAGGSRTAEIAQMRRAHAFIRTSAYEKGFVPYAGALLESAGSELDNLVGRRKGFGGISRVEEAMGNAQQLGHITAGESRNYANQEGLVAAMQGLTSCSPRKLTGDRGKFAE